MKLIITFNIPYNYKHGTPSKKYFSESISVFSIRPRTQEFLNELFRLTKIYQNFKYFSFNYYFDWKPINDISDNFYASPKIFVFHNDSKLIYFHFPSIEDINFDLYLLTGEINSNIPVDLFESIDTNNLSGEYIIHF